MPPKAVMKILRGNCKKLSENRTKSEHRLGNTLNTTLITMCQETIDNQSTFNMTQIYLDLGVHRLRFEICVIINAAKETKTDKEEEGSKEQG